MGFLSEACRILVLNVGATREDRCAGCEQEPQGLISPVRQARVTWLGKGWAP